MTTELNPGPELDKAVATACGLKETKVRFPSGELIPAWETTGNNVILAHSFHPSTDLNDAFLAAEKAGLFEEHVYLGYSDHKWKITREECCIEDCEEPWHNVIATAQSPALAICKAILKLTEQQ